MVFENKGFFRAVYVSLTKLCLGDLWQEIKRFYTIYGNVFS